LVPDFDTELTMPPDDNPYSASNCPVSSWNSCTASMGTRACAPPLPPLKVSLLFDPSIV
jgi:hypothetical protein